MIPKEPIVLEGEDSKQFEKYRKRPATQDEIDYFAKAHKYYLDNCPDTKSLKNKRQLISSTFLLFYDNCMSGDEAPKLKYEKLSPEIDVTELDCTDDDSNLDAKEVHEFLHKYARDHHEDNLGLTYVAYENNKPVGYITLAAATMYDKDIHQANRPSTHVTSVFPAVLIAYTGVHKNERNRKIGSKILLFAAGVAVEVAQKIGCRYVVLYTRSKQDFYKKNHYELTNKKNKDGAWLMYADLFPQRKPNQLSFIAIRESMFVSVEPSMKCSNCGQPMTAQININVGKKWKHPEKIGTRDQPIGTNNEHWCLACIRGKNDRAWLKPK